MFAHGGGAEKPRHPELRDTDPKATSHSACHGGRLRASRPGDVLLPAGARRNAAARPVPPCPAQRRPRLESAPTGASPSNTFTAQMHSEPVCSPHASCGNTDSHRGSLQPSTPIRSCRHHGTALWPSPREISEDMLPKLRQPRYMILQSLESLTSSHRDLLSDSFASHVVLALRLFPQPVTGPCSERHDQARMS
ncbi:hypothetical protein PSPO01_14320 [Paraphaeosphaeria sporulosa]